MRLYHHDNLRLRPLYIVTNNLCTLYIRFDSSITSRERDCFCFRTQLVQRKMEVRGRRGTGKTHTQGVHQIPRTCRQASSACAYVRIYAGPSHSSSVMHHFQQHAISALLLLSSPSLESNHLFIITFAACRQQRLSRSHAHISTQSTNNRRGKTMMPHVVS